MDRGVHYEMTRRWALEAGFSADESEEIAAADWNVDAVRDVRVWANKRYHFAWLGADRMARRLSAEAADTGDLKLLGEALHCRQDAIGHGFWGHVVHWNGIDHYDRRGAKVRARLESASRAMLSEYLGRRHALLLSQVDATMVSVRAGS